MLALRAKFDLDWPEAMAFGHDVSKFLVSKFLDKIKKNGWPQASHPQSTNPPLMADEVPEVRTPTNRARALLSRRPPAARMQIKLSASPASPKKRPLLGQEEDIEEEEEPSAAVKRLSSENEQLRRLLRTMEQRVQHHSQQMSTYEALLENYKKSRETFLRSIFQRSHQMSQQHSSYFRALAHNFKMLIGDAECVTHCCESFSITEDDDEESILTDQERIMKLACGHLIHARCASMIFSSEKNVFQCPLRCEKQARFIEPSDFPSKSEYFGGSLDNEALTVVDVLTTSSCSSATTYLNGLMPTLPIYAASLFITPPSREFPLVLSTPEYQVLRRPPVLMTSEQFWASVAVEAPAATTPPQLPQASPSLSPQVAQVPASTTPVLTYLTPN